MDFKTSIETNHTYVIAELSANHNQDFNLAVKTIEEISKTGADAVKIQTYTPDSLVMNIDNSHFGMIQTGLWKGMTRYQLYQKAYMPYEWQPKLKEIAENLGLEFFSTPFDKEGVDFLEKMNMPIYKIASFEVNDIPLIKYVARLNKPMIISTGVADYDDIRLVLDTCEKENNKKVSLLKCTSEYPATLEQANLATIPDMIKTFNVNVGVSDHTMGYIVPMTAIALGAKIVEKHFILNRNLGGPDSSFSMEPLEFKEMIDNIRKEEQTIGTVKSSITNREKLKRRAIYATKDISVGEIFSEDNTKSFRPADGLSPAYYEKLLGLKSKRIIKKGEPILSTDIYNN